MQRQMPDLHSRSVIDDLYALKLEVELLVYLKERGFSHNQCTSLPLRKISNEWWGWKRFDILKGSLYTCVLCEHASRKSPIFSAVNNGRCRACLLNLVISDVNKDKCGEIIFSPNGTDKAIDICNSMLIKLVTLPKGENRGREK